MGMIKEFKEFAMRGNVIDMAVGIVIGAAFGKIVSSIVGDIIMPIVGFITGGVDFSKASYTLKEAVPASEGVEATEAVVVGYGNLVQTTIDFIIIAFAIFMVIKVINTAKKRFEEEKVEEPAKASAEVQLLTEIRDSLQAKN
ncbi:large-conductance mechanosensitive channel protein MscL [Phycisphaeraceae bacterium D3-23]